MSAKEPDKSSKTEHLTVEPENRISNSRNPQEERSSVNQEIGLKSDSAVDTGSVYHRKSILRNVKTNQGKTLHPRCLPPKEIRKLSRKNALLEKNLKIEGLPERPKFRKRRLSVGAAAGRPNDKDSPFKRKRLGSIDGRKSDHMPKWELMGGDAQDPLNLNGLAGTEEGMRLNLKTPENSPLPTPDFRKLVYVKVPPNIEDPLNLEGKHDQSELDRLLNSRIRKPKRKRTRNKNREDAQAVAGAATNAAPSAPAETTDTCDISDSQKETAHPPQELLQAPASVISECVKQKSEQTTPEKASTPGSGTGSRSRSRSISMSPERRFKRQLSGSSGKSRPAPVPQPQFKYPEKPKFTCGNYNRYYGYRNAGGVSDPRLQYFDMKWFKGKDILDIGCNAGHLTLALADQYQPQKILGMDIDGRLIQAARQNIRHILSQRRKDSTKYPKVLEMTRGSLEAHPLMGSSDQFPNNVLFLQGNYVPGSEEILNLQKEEYDTILALSITKWIHLNNGDNGLKLFFRKIFKQLRPGGKLILEPQPWSTYRKRAKLTPELFANYQSIKLKPEGFKHYLLSIGFVKCEVIGVPVTKAKGFRRPLLLFTKQDNGQTVSPSSSMDADQDYSNICQECGNVDKTMCDHPQFTGVRRGPYASYLYDHVNYPSYSSDSPMFVANQRANPTYGGGGYSSSGLGGLFEHQSCDSRDPWDFSYDSGSFPPRMPQLSHEPLDRDRNGNMGISSSHNSMCSSRSGCRSSWSSRSSYSSNGSYSSIGSASGSSSCSSTPRSTLSRSASTSTSLSPDIHSCSNGGLLSYSNSFVNGGVDFVSNTNEALLPLASNIEQRHATEEESEVLQGTNQEVPAGLVFDRTEDVERETDVGITFEVFERGDVANAGQIEVSGAERLSNNLDQDTDTPSSLAMQNTEDSCSHEPFAPEVKVSANSQSETNATQDSVNSPGLESGGNALPREQIITDFHSDSKQGSDFEMGAAPANETVVASEPTGHQNQSQGLTASAIPDINPQNTQVLDSGTIQEGDAQDISEQPDLNISQTEMIKDSNDQGSASTDKQDSGT